MAEQTSATIIAFPRMKEAATRDAGEGTPRLQRALAALEQALAEQRVAVARWRDSLGELHGSVQGLGASLGSYNERLGALADDVDGLNRTARQTEAWADRALARDDAEALAQP